MAGPATPAAPSADARPRPGHAVLTMTRRYVTTAAAPHLPQLRVLLASMRRHCGSFRLHLLAEGPEVSRWAAWQPDVEATDVRAFLKRHPDLAPDRLPGPPRNGNERACCWRWTFLCDVMAATGRPVLAVDCDLMFWSSPEPVFEEVEGAPAAVLPHAFAPRDAGLPGVTMETHRRYGLFNGGFVYFGERGVAATMADLAKECSHATDHVWPDGRVTWGDQGALEIIHEIYAARVIEHPGAAPGPWNIHAQPLEYRGHIRRDGGWRDGVLHFGDRPLVSYHYQSYRHGRQLADAPYAITPEQAALLYEPYAAALVAVELAARARAAVRMAPAPAPTPPPAPPPCRSGRCILGAENCDNPDHRP